MLDLLETKREQISQACDRHGVSRLHVFGSAGSGGFQPDTSDIDLLVELRPMEEYARVDAYFGLLDELRTLLGFEVDLVMEGAVTNPYIARDIERTKKILYAA